MRVSLLVVTFVLTSGFGYMSRNVACAAFTDDESTSAAIPKSDAQNKKDEAEKEDSARVVGNPFREQAKVRRATTPMEAMRATMSESELQYFFERAVFDPEDPALIKVLDYYPRLGRPNIEQFAKLESNVPLNEAMADPSKYGTQIFTLRGTVTQCVKQNVFPSVAEAFDFDHFYMVSMQLPDLSAPALICTRHVPAAWLKSMESGAEFSAGCFGMFLQVVESAEDVIRPVFVADRVEWYPTEENADLGIGPSQVFLSQLGFDAGLYKELARQNNTETLPGEPIYQMFKALNKAEPGSLSKLAESKLDLADVLQSPGKLHGRVFWVRGNARRVQEVKDDPADYFIERFGIDRYYAIDMFIPLSNTIELSHKDGGKPVKYEAHFPATIYVLKLPEGMEVGKKTNYEIQVPCVFFKLWAYPSKYVESKSGGVMQPAPLMLGVQPKLVARGKSISSSVAMLMIALFAVVLGGIWFFLWRAGRRDDEFKQEQLMKRFESDGKSPLKDVDVKADAGPNFDNIE